MKVRVLDTTAGVVGVAEVEFGGIMILRPDGTSKLPMDDEGNVVKPWFQVRRGTVKPEHIRSIVRDLQIDQQHGELDKGLIWQRA